MKRFISISLFLSLLLVMGGAILIDAYARLLTGAGGWAITGTPMDIGLPYEEARLTTSDGLEISGWYFRGRRSEAVIVVHGIWANKQAMMPAAIMLVEAGYHVLTIDMRGHGQSQGEQISYGYYEALDVVAGVDYLLARPEIEQVGVMGYSLGGAAVARAAALDDRIGAVVIESSFSSMADAVDDSFTQHTKFPRWSFAPLLVKAAERRLGVHVEQIDSARDLAAMTPRPVLIIHGSEDDLFPVEHAYKMYEAAPEPKELWLIDGLRHGYPLDHKATYQKRVLTFFETAFTR